MTEDKQIEKMARDVCPLTEDYGSCEACDAELDIEDDPCLYKCMSKLFISKGYCKASEVAEDIVRMLRAAGINEWRYPIVADIRKKYMEVAVDEE